MKIDHIFSIVLLLFPITFFAHNDELPFPTNLNPYEINSILQKYKQSLNEKCAGKSTEKCLELIANYKIVEHKRKLTELRNEVAPYIFAPWSAQDAEKEEFSENSLRNLETIATYLNQHQKYQQAREIASFYENFPNERQSIVSWVKQQVLTSEQYPCHKYQQIAQEHRKLIKSFDKETHNSYPKLTHQLYQIDAHIDDIINAIQSELENEVAKKNQAEKIKTQQRIAQAAEDQVQAERAKTNAYLNLKDEERTTQNIMRNLESSLKAISSYDMNTQYSIATTLQQIENLQRNLDRKKSEEYTMRDKLEKAKTSLSLRQYDQDLINQKSSLQQDIELKRSSIAKIEKEITQLTNTYISKQYPDLTQAQRKKIIEKIAEYEAEITVLKTEQQAWNKFKNILNREINALNSNNTTQAQPVSSRQATAIPVARAVNAHDDVYTGPIAEAYVVPQATQPERSEKQ